MSDYSESWITDQVNGRQQSGPVCVEVRIKTSGLDLHVVTPGCGGGGGGIGRRATANEQEIIDLWTKRGLNEAGFSGGNVIAFLKQLRQKLP